MTGKVFGVVLSSALLFGCAGINPAFYRDYYAPMSEGQKRAFQLNEGEPEIYPYSENRERDETRLYEEGYELLGAFSFRGMRLSERDLRAHGKLVKAHIIMVSAKYIDTITESIPLTLPSYTSVSGDVNLDIYTPKTTMIPSTFDRYDQVSTFWAKLKMPVLGVYWAGSPISLQEKFERDEGLLIRAVRKGSPAFQSGIMPGDVLVEIAGLEIISGDQFSRLLDSLAGTEAAITLIRSGQTLQVRVPLNPLP